ncbi:hypothetical protein ID866_3569 [Astraeus odoratus]|nr:hypothetical protein ID866_3569 [Astraeus odoratus]
MANPHSTEPHIHHDVHRGVHALHLPPDVAGANRKFFNDPANEHLFNAEARAGAKLLVAAMLKAYPFDKEKTAVMDFACGTGNISEELEAHVKSIIGVDISQRVVDIYNRNANERRVSPDVRSAVCVAELKENEAQLQGRAFDLIVCASAYHHLESILDVTKVLASYLKPGGSLLVADIMKNKFPETMFPPGAHHMVAHKEGFGAADMRTAFEGAGLQNFSFVEAETLAFLGHEMPYFLAKGDK